MDYSVRFCDLYIAFLTVFETNARIDLELLLWQATTKLKLKLKLKLMKLTF